MKRARVIGVGQRAAGDDAVGLAALDSLRAALPAWATTHVVGDATDLIPLLETDEKVIILDAYLGEVGRVRVVQPTSVDTIASSAVSTHGISVGQAIELATTLFPETVSKQVVVVAIGITRPTTYSESLSPLGESAVREARRVVLELLQEEGHA